MLYTSGLSGEEIYVTPSPHAMFPDGKHQSKHLEDDKND